MQIEKRLKNHYKRWNIVLDYEEEFLKFKNRLIEILNKLIGEYLAKNSDIDKQFREIFKLDNLRFALEQLLKKILSNQKSLENQKSPLGSWLKEKGLHSQVINSYQTLLKEYQNYQNDAVKHNENYSFDEVEFMIYLTGNFMRLLIQFASRARDIK